MDADERERPVCRCNDCLTAIKKSEDDLSSALRTMDYHIVDKALLHIIHNNIDIDVKLKHLA